ncbi:unnamed protein product [Gulo gulo]|uniref:Uncharacterized protein n=1 Tax=Gulo gulo TaxID=48420 RepID=A0A9X9LF21_GULGU|nr:unnamed protein product [Gulo gulo]
MPPTFNSKENTYFPQGIGFRNVCINTVNLLRARLNYTRSGSCKANKNKT